MPTIRYQRDELLKLRESPLVVKPDNLPPIDEWMGPLQDPSTQKKNSRDQTGISDSSNHQRRSSFFESRHISRPSNSEDLILGPPKTSFASATRGFGKADSTDKPFKSTDHDDTRQDRYGGFREKFFKDREYGDKDKDSDRRDSRSHITNGRRMNRDEREDWNNRPRRNFGLDEDRDKRPTRRSGDLDRWDGRDKEHRDQQEGNERSHRDREHGRFLGRRDTIGRQRHDPPWYRDNDAQETGENEEEKTPVRNREWRRGLHSHDRDWNKSTKHENDPEWMDSTPRSDTKETHTQEDFQRWKERMKAGHAQVTTDAKKGSADESLDESKNVEGTQPDSEKPSKPSSSLQKGADLDNFFGFWDERKGALDNSSDNTGAETKKDAPTTKLSKPSRFAGFFNTQTETKEMDMPSQQNVPRPASTDADQEGFQRILQMLGGNKSSNATPHGEEPSQPSPQVAQVNQSEKASLLAASPLRETFNRQDYLAMQEQIPRRPPPGLDNSSGPPMLPQDDAGPPPDYDSLMRLMQNSKVSSQTPIDQNPPPMGRPPQQLLTSLSNTTSTQQTPVDQNLPPRTYASVIDLLNGRPIQKGPSDQHPVPVMSSSAMFDGRDGRQGIQAQKNTMYMEDPMIPQLRRPDPNDPRIQLRRRPTGGPAGYFDEMPYPGGSSGNHTPNNPPSLRPQGPPQPPMGMRPHGIDHINPNWQNQQMPPQQPVSAHMMYPPNLANPQARNPNTNQPPAPSMPIPPWMAPPADRPPFQRGASGNPPGGFVPPPGIMPPPGYVNMNAPPPSGYAPIPHSAEAMMNLSHGHPSHYGAGPPLGPHQPSSRLLLDLFAQQQGANPADGHINPRPGAGMMGPGPYR